jgi:golgi SNAP receptor complex member 1
MADWDSLKFSYRDASQRLDGAVRDITKVQAELARRRRLSSSTPAPDDDSLYTQAADLFSTYTITLGECNEQLSRMSRLIPRTDTTRQAHLERFRTQLQQQSRDWERAYNAIENERNRSQLLSSGSRSQSMNGDGTANTMLQERTALVQSMGMIDGTLESAFATQEMLNSQKTRISNYGEKLAGLTSTIPGIRTLVSRINTRQCQETVILGLVIGVCISLLLWMRILR